MNILVKAEMRRREMRDGREGGGRGVGGAGGEKGGAGGGGGKEDNQIKTRDFHIVVSPGFSAVHREHQPSALQGDLQVAPDLRSDQEVCVCVCVCVSRTMTATVRRCV